MAAHFSESDKAGRSPRLSFDQILAVVAVQQSDTVDLHIPVGTGAVLGLLEDTVGDSLGVLLVVGVGVDVSHVGGDGLAANGEVSSVEDVDGAVLQASQDLVQLLLGAGSTVLVRRYRDVEGEVTLTEEYSHCFESGALVFPNTVTSTVLSVYMEPDFDRAAGRKFGPVSMGFVAADDNGDLPVFRYCHDLQDGKVEVR